MLTKPIIIYFSLKLIYKLTTLCLTWDTSMCDFMDVTMGDIPNRAWLVSSPLNWLFGNWQMAVGPNPIIFFCHSHEVWVYVLGLYVWYMVPPPSVYWRITWRTSAPAPALKDAPIGNQVKATRACVAFSTDNDLSVPLLPKCPSPPPPLETLEHTGYVWSLYSA